MQKYLHTTWRLWKLLKPFHKDFYLQLFYIISQQLLQIYNVYLTARILNLLIDKNFNDAYIYGLYILALGSISILLSYLQTMNNTKKLDGLLISHLQEYSLVNILSLNAFQYVEDHSAIKISIVNKGEHAVKSTLSSIVTVILPTVSKTIFSIIAISILSPLIGLICTITFIIAIIWTTLFAKYHRQFIKQNSDNADVFSKFRTETFQHLTLIKSSGAEVSYLKKYLSERTAFFNYFVFTWKKSIVNWHIRFEYFHLIRILMVAIVIYQTKAGKLLVGNIYAIWSWVSDIFMSVNMLTNATRELPQNFVDIDKYLAIVDKKPEFIESGSKKFDFGDIEFRDVSFKYPKGETNLLENFNLTIEKGKKTAFVGFSGSGKSTIIKLLLRMYDWNSGDIKLGGKSLREIDAQTLRQRIGYVEQHVDLFDISIKDNILFGAKDKKMSKDKLNEIVHKARIDQFFHRLGSTGLDTLIGERGVKLSGGERQRIGIARALAKDPEILIFDEATASLDTENGKYIQEAIDESSKGRTTIIIAHRLSTVQNSDRIIVMDKGKIVAMNTHEFLKDTSPEYQRLIHAQTN